MSFTMYSSEHVYQLHTVVFADESAWLNINVTADVMLDILSAVALILSQADSPISMADGF